MSEIILNNVRIAFPDLFTPRAYQDSAPAYGAMFYIEDTSPLIAVINAEIARVSQEKWREKAKQVLGNLDGNTQKNCWIEGSRRHASLAGGWTLKAKRRTQDGTPGVVDRNPNIHITEKDGRIYSGCFVNAKVDIWAQDKEGMRGLRCTLIAVQFADDGDAWSSAPPATTDGFVDMSSGADAIALF